MDSIMQQMLHAIAHNTHQKNRTDSADYVEQWASEPKRGWLFRRGIPRQGKRRHTNTAFAPRPALHKLR